MGINSHRSTPQSQNDEDKTPYAAPELAVMGSVEELTHGVSTSVNPDNPSQQGFKEFKDNAVTLG